MEKDWAVINSIFEEKTKEFVDVFRGHSKLSEEEKQILAFLDDEVGKFPTKGDLIGSASLFRKYLHEKYPKLSEEGIDSLSHHFCFVNR